MIDARLVGPAGSAWGAAAVVFIGGAHDGAAVAWVLGGVMAVGALLLLALRTQHAAVLATVASGAIVGALSAGLAVDSLHAEPLRGWVTQRAVATVTATIDGGPVRRDPPPGSWLPARTTVRITAIQVDARGSDVRIRVPMVLQAEWGTPLPPPGALVVIHGRLKPASAVGLAAVITVRSAADVRVLADPGLLPSAANRMREGLRAALAHGPPDGAALVAGLAIGDESLQTGELTDAMRASGLSHLTAVSGGNTAIVLAVALLLASALGFRRWGRVLFALAALGYFVVLVGPEPSVVRAAVMGAVVVLALLTGGRRAGPSVLAAAVLGVVIAAPTLAVSWGFALSVFATAGLIVIAPMVLRRLRAHAVTGHWPVPLLEAIALTVAAQLATAPLLVTMGGAVGWVALPANLLAMPAVAPVTVLGLFAALVSPVSPWLATITAVIASWPAQWIAWVAMWAAGLPLARLPWPSGAAGLGLLLLCAISAWWVRRWVRHRWPQGVPRSIRRASLVVSAVCLVVLVLAPPSRRGWPPPGWLMIMCDVGQGDAIVLNAGNGQAMLVDTGPEAARVDRCLTDARIDHIPLLVLTHFHADHVGGIGGAGRGRTIDSTVVTILDDPPEQAADTYAWLARRQVPVHRVQVPSVLRVGPVSATVRWPVRLVSGGSAPNNASIVLDVVTSGTRILLTGDIEAEAQRALLADGPLAADIVKVPHHGSANGDPRLPIRTGARLALVSVGEGNVYGHPAPATDAAWRQQAILGRTDHDGDLAVVRTPDGRIGLVRRD